VAVSTLLLMVPGGFLVYGAWQERQLTQQWRGIVSTIPRSVSTEAPTEIPAAAPEPIVATPAPTTPVVTKTTATPIAFAISVPKLGYYSAVVEGVDLGHLAMGPGHYPMTAYPGHKGTVGVAAHNNYWIRFGDLKPGDKIVLEARNGTFTYVMTGSRIVMPDDKSVFAGSGDGYRLTLTSCWPLWAGVLATRRLVIFAQEEGGVG
jgi:LPXTG-site transpeptidase (sortase) family protein